MDDITAQYLLFVFVASCGVIQFAAARAKLTGLLFFRRPSLGYLLGSALITWAFYWFFGSADRNLPGLNGSEQFGNFVFASSGALLFTLLSSSLIKMRVKTHPSSPGERYEPEASQGLETLKRMSYLEAALGNFKTEEKNAPHRQAALSVDQRPGGKSTDLR